MNPAGQIKFISAGGEFNLGLITSKLDFLEFNAVYLLLSNRQLYLFQCLVCILNDLKKTN